MSDGGLIAQEASNTNTSGEVGDTLNYVEYTTVEVNEANSDNMEGTTEEGLTTTISLDESQQQQLASDTILQFVENPVLQISEDQQQDILIKYENLIQCDTCFQIFASQELFNSHVDYCSAPPSDTTIVSISENPQPVESDIVFTVPQPTSTNINQSNSAIINVQPVAVKMTEMSGGRRKQRIESRKVEEGNYEDIPTLKTNRPVTSVSTTALAALQQGGNLKRKTITVTDYQDPLARKKVVFVNPKSQDQALLSSAKNSAELLRRKVQITGKVPLSMEAAKQLIQNKSGMATTEKRFATFKVLPTAKLTAQSPSSSTLSGKEKKVFVNKTPENTLLNAKSSVGRKLTKTPGSPEHVNTTTKQVMGVTAISTGRGVQVYKKAASKNPSVQPVVQPSKVVKESSLVVEQKDSASDEEQTSPRRPGRPRKRPATELEIPKKSPKTEVSSGHEENSKSPKKIDPEATLVIASPEKTTDEGQKRRPGRPFKVAQGKNVKQIENQVKTNNGEIFKKKQLAQTTGVSTAPKQDDLSGDSSQLNKSELTGKDAQSGNDDSKRKPQPSPKKRFLIPSKGDSVKSQNPLSKAAATPKDENRSALAPTSDVMAETVITQKQVSDLVSAPLNKDDLNADSGKVVQKRRGRPAKRPQVTAPANLEIKTPVENFSRTGRRRIRSTKLLDYIDLDEEAM